MTTVAIIQARLGSSRLPRKVLEPLGDDRVIDHVVRRTLRASGLDEVVLAVPSDDDALIDAGRQHGIRVVEGSDADVLDRFEVARRATKADIVVRITADCPLIDPHVVTNAVARQATLGVDYYFLDGYPRGLGDAEVLTGEALAKAASSATRAADREHVVTFLTRRPRDFSSVIEQAQPPFLRPELRVCVDEQRDLDAVRALVAELEERGGGSTTLDVIRALDDRPDIVAMNAMVRQRS